MELIKKILVPVDFSPYSQSALKYAKSFAEKLDAEIICVYVIEPLIFPADFSMGQISFPVIDAETTERAKNEMNSLINNEFGETNSIKSIIRTGKPFIEINEAAREINADLIIIASHGHTGVEHLLFGSTAEKVVKKAPCPVLTLREPVKGFKYKN